VKKSYGNSNENVAAIFASWSVLFRLLASSEERLTVGGSREELSSACGREKAGGNYPFAANDAPSNHMQIHEAHGSPPKEEAEEVLLGNIEVA
jgi:hypothetical protein